MINKHQNQPSKRTPHRNKELGYFLNGLKEGDPTVLSKAITLVESTLPYDFHLGQQLIEKCLPTSGNSFRIAITGAPGVGKSTFIEALGKLLVLKGHKIAVLAIDPSSENAKGSILGDKTRMSSLVKYNNVFVRPSPTGNAMGGVAKKTRETILLCESAGYDIILVETVGVGQSEIMVREMVDFVLLLMITGAGDQLQGIKRGVIEIADGIAINKEDGTNVESARLLKQELQRVLELFPEKPTGWKPKVSTCSALEKRGIDSIWQMILFYFKDLEETSALYQLRNKQKEKWLYQTLEQRILQSFHNNSEVQQAIKKALKQISENRISTFTAAEKILKQFYKKY